MKPAAFITTLAAALWLALPASASAAPEIGDAGDLPGTAQDLSAAPVDAIDGSIAHGTDQDLYRVCLEGGGSFSATTVGGSELDTQLFLFDAAALGVYGNDDSQATRQSTLPAGHELTPTAPGVYLLAVTPYNRDPRSTGGAIFVGGGVLAPDGPGGDQALASWAGQVGLPGDYHVALSGTTGCAPPDETPPTVDLRVPEDGARVPRGALVAVDYDCADEDGGSGLASCAGSLADGALLDTSTFGPGAVTVAARDNAGNETVVTHAYEVVDATPPTIELRSPLEGAVFLLGQEALADYECADEPGGSGLASCEGDVPSGSAIDTSAPGEHTFTVEAADAAGNAVSTSRSYRVLYDWGGFLWPIEDRPAVNRARAGRLVLVRFSLNGFHGRHVLADGYPQVAEVECGSGAEAEAGEPARILRRWKHRHRSRKHRGYAFVWKTRRSWAGSCRQLLLGLADGTVRRADFEFSGSHHRR